jgi:hypothetical protein
MNIVAPAAHPSHGKGDDGRHGRDDGQTQWNRADAPQQGREEHLPEHKRGEDERQDGLQARRAGKHDEQPREKHNEQQLRVETIMATGDRIGGLAVPQLVLHQNVVARLVEFVHLKLAGQDILRREHGALVRAGNQFNGLETGPGF